MLDILGLSVSQRSPEDKRSTKVNNSDKRIINFITIHQHLLEIAAYLLAVLIDFPQNLTNANILGQGN